MRYASSASSDSNSGHCARMAAYSLGTAASLRSIWRRTLAGRGVFAEPTTVSRTGIVQRTISEPESRARSAVTWVEVISMMLSA